MEITTKYTIDMLTNESVSILKKSFITLEGKEHQIGENLRKDYLNSITDRQQIIENLPEAQVNAILAVWGLEPTITESEGEI